MKKCLPEISFRTLQKQSLEVFYHKRGSQKFRKIHSKTPASESFFLIKLQSLGLQLY